MSCSRKTFRKKRTAKKWAKSHGGSVRGSRGKYKVCKGKRKK